MSKIRIPCSTLLTDFNNPSKKHFLADYKNCWRIKNLRADLPEKVYMAIDESINTSVTENIQKINAKDPHRFCKNRSMLCLLCSMYIYIMTVVVHTWYIISCNPFDDWYTSINSHISIKVIIEQKIQPGNISMKRNYCNESGAHQVQCKHSCFNFYPRNDYICRCPSPRKELNRSYEVCYV